MLAFAAGVVPGCGGDDERAETTPALPELTIPRTEATTPPATTPPPEPTVPPEQTETLPPDGDGGAPAPTPEPPADSPENDTPPPADSPAERFEEFCDENPGACG